MRNNDHTSYPFHFFSFDEVRKFEKKTIRLFFSFEKKSDWFIFQSLKKKRLDFFSRESSRLIFFKMIKLRLL
jgi:hypothetical protein